MPYVPLDCFAIARPKGRASPDALWLAMTAVVPFNHSRLCGGREREPTQGPAQRKLATPRRFRSRIFLRKVFRFSPRISAALI